MGADPSDTASHTLQRVGKQKDMPVREEKEPWEPLPEGAPAFPTAITLAGTAWIAFGALILVNAALVLVFGRAGYGGPSPGAVCIGLFCTLFEFAFIIVGVQTVPGTARDTLCNGIGSIVFGLLHVGYAALAVLAGQLLPAGVSFLVGGGLLTAGVLALTARGDYKRWRRAQRFQRERRPDGWPE